VRLSDAEAKLTNQEVVGHIMKMVAIELKSLIGLNQRSQVNRILKLLLDDTLLDEGTSLYMS